TMTSKKIKKIRAKLGLTQRELAELVGIAPNNIAKQERGELGIHPAVSKLARIIAGLEEVPSLGPSHPKGSGRKVADLRKDSRKSAASVRAHGARPRKSSLSK